MTRLALAQMGNAVQGRWSHALQQDGGRPKGEASFACYISSRGSQHKLGVGIRSYIRLLSHRLVVVLHVTQSRRRCVHVKDWVSAYFHLCTCAFIPGPAIFYSGVPVLGGDALS